MPRAWARASACPTSVAAPPPGFSGVLSGGCGAWGPRDGGHDRQWLSGYRSRRFAATCHALGLRHLFTRPYIPRINGKAERFIKTALLEWAYVRLYRHSEERAQALTHWLHHYNWYRPHSALGGEPPITRVISSADNLVRLHKLPETRLVSIVILCCGQAHFLPVAIERRLRAELSAHRGHDGGRRCVRGCHRGGDPRRTMHQTMSRP